jgi:cell wall-associated NlpC family hydrolase
VLAAFLGLALSINPAAAPQAHAAVSASLSYQARMVAEAQKGVPYRYGGASPSGFDCSGLVQYSYKRVGKYVPRTAQAQYNAAVMIRSSSARPGDLIFFSSGRSVYHVGIYAGTWRGARYIIHAPKPGRRVTKVKLWTSQVTYGRVR